MLSDVIQSSDGICKYEYVSTWAATGLIDETKKDSAAVRNTTYT